MNCQFLLLAGDAEPPSAPPLKMFTERCDSNISGSFQIRTKKGSGNNRFFNGV